MTGIYVDSIKDKSNTKTLATLSSSAVTLDSGVSFPAGHIIQVLSNTAEPSVEWNGDNTAFETSGGPSVAIAIASGNKVFLTYSVTANPNGAGMYLDFSDGTTNNLSGASNGILQISGTTNLPATITLLYDPSSTSSVTYTLGFRMSTGTTGYLGNSSQKPRITAMEVVV